jgi:ceramide glucosyltransferase
MLTSFLVVWAALSVVVPTTLLSVAFFLALGRTRHRKGVQTSVGPSVHLVRPLCGREEGADEKNLSLLRQDYAPLTVTFVAESEIDLGLTDARRVCKAEGRGTCLTARDESAVSGKARNMIAGWRASTSDVVAFCDSDITLSAGDIGRCVSAMVESNARAAFAPCLFDAEGLWGRLAMHVATIDKYALAEAGAALGLVPCMEGGLMLVSRSALEAAGGIEVISRTLADDLRIGSALRAHGFRLGMSATPILHRSAPESARVWARRYLRWSICRRTEAPWFQLIALALNPILVPLIVAITLSSTSSWAFLLTGILWRIGYSHAASRFLLAPHGIHIRGWCWARPITEALDAAFVAIAFLTRSLTWRDCAYNIDFRGRVTRAVQRPPTGSLVLDRAPSCK